MNAPEAHIRIKKNNALAAEFDRKADAVRAVRTMNRQAEVMGLDVVYVLHSGPFV